MTDTDDAAAFDPEAELIRDAGSMPLVPIELHDRIVNAGLCARRRKLRVARIQAVVLSLLLFVSTSSVSGYYLTLWYGDSLTFPRPTRSVPSPVAQERTQAVDRLAASWSSTDEWAPVEAWIGLRSTKSRMLIRVQ